MTSSSPADDDRFEGVTPSVSRALVLFTERVVASYGPRVSRVVLFGSRARGEATPESDIDVAVVLDAIDERDAQCGYCWRRRECALKRRAFGSVGYLTPSYGCRA